LSVPLRYQWKQGESYVYSVQVEASEEGYTETVGGEVIYTVRSLDGDQATLTYRSHLVPGRRPKPGKSMSVSVPFGLGHFWAGRPFSGSAPQLRLDVKGQLLERSGRHTPLPQALGDLERLVFEPLSPQGRRAWEADVDYTIVYRVVAPRRGPFGHAEEKSFPAHEKTPYDLAGGAGPSVSIRKQYELKTQEKVGAEPRLQLLGLGTITFDAAAGLPLAMEFAGTFTDSTENTTHHTPLKVSYKLLEGQDKEKALNPPPPAKVEAKELSATDLHEALLDLRATDLGPRQRAADKLSRAMPTDSRGEVVSSLVAAMSDSNRAVRQTVARALGVWGTEAALAPLVKALEDPEPAVRWAAIDALGALKDPRAAEPLARHLAQGTDSMPTARALISLGPPAQRAVIGSLKAKSPEVRREACRVLQSIGGRQSVPALETATGDSDPLVAMLAKEALKAVNARP
jgi:hypothetical protein